MSAAPIIDTERGDLPSASSLESYSLCPGKWHAERHAPKEDTQTRAYSDSGTRVHAALAGDSVELSDEEQDMVERCQAAEQRLIGYFGGSAPIIEREIRLWLFRDMRKAFSGKADLVARHGSRALILDYKSLWGDHEHSTNNMQLRALAVLADEEYSLDEVAVAIVQPNVTGNPGVCVYGKLELSEARRELLNILDAIKPENAPRIPGKQCKFCKAKLICPEAQAQISVVQTVGQSLATMDGARLGDFLNLIADAKHVINAAEAEAKRRLNAGEAVPGWELSPGKNRRVVTDVQRVFNAAAACGVGTEEFVAICDIGLKDLEKALRKATGTKGAALKQTVDSVLDGAIEIKQSAKSLHRIGAAPEDEE